MFQRTLPAQGHLHALFRRPTPIGRKDDRLSNLSQCLTEWKVHVLRGRQAIRSAWEFSELFLCVKRVGDTKMRREFQQCFSSTFYITYNKANITQFDAYLPYGELLVDEHSSTEEMPYKFNGKELDQETGLYYYGARYMNPLTSLCYGVDPLAEKYATIGGYVYCVSNPIRLIDTDGRKVYMLFYTTGNKRGDDMFYAAALTKRNNILRSEGYNPKKDIVILSSIKDLSNIASIVRNNVKMYSEKNGKTAEFSIWSHAGLDGPTGTAQTSSYPLDSKQMFIEGWSKINFNRDFNTSVYFFGCITGVSDGNTPSFTTKISGKHNFNGVEVYGQTSYAYPSQYVNYRENSDWGDDSFWKKKGDKIIFSPTYMVGGVVKHDIFNFDSSTTVYPMRSSKNGKGKVLNNQFQPGKSISK